MQIPLLAAAQLFQFTAILGDLQHKTDLYLATQSFDPAVSCRFSALEQVRYIIIRHPHLVAACPNCNNHTLSSWFEFSYYSNLTFRFDYLSHFVDFSC
jgi:hypothetical protein